MPLLVRSDIDGFLGLALDNLIQFLLILTLCKGILQFSDELILRTVLPAAALSLVIGNVYYALQARRLAQRTGRDDVTALPYGINTVSLFAFIFLVMLPARLAALNDGADSERAAEIAWQVGLWACLISGVIELAGAFVAEWIRKVTPRAALLSTLSGIAIGFISIEFAIQTFELPLIAFVPLAVIMATYFAGARMPLGLPGGLWAVILGAAAAWICYGLKSGAGVELPTPVDPAGVRAAAGDVGLYLPVPVIGDLVASAGNPIVWQTLVSVMVPMGLFNVLGSLQNIESAEAAGDSFPTRPSLAVNGIGSIVAAGFGSCFPTTIYIGHPGWKAMGAKSGYSLLNGIVFAVVALLGVIGLIGAVVPIAAGIAIVLYIGIVITAQAFGATPQRHGPAVALGLFPAIAAWGALVLQMGLGGMSFRLAGDLGKAPHEVFDMVARPEVLGAAGLHLDGLVAISAGFMLTCMIWAAIAAHLIDHEPRKALGWALAGAGFSFFGLMHTGTLTSSGIVQEIGIGVGWPWAVGYGLVALFVGVLALVAKNATPAARPATATASAEDPV